jgi:hypothetical protein
MVSAIISLRPSLPPISDELRKRVQSIRVRSTPEEHSSRTSVQADRSNWRHKQATPSTSNTQREQVTNQWRQTSGQQPGSPFRFLNSQPDRSPKPTISRVSSQTSIPSTPNTPLSSGTPKAWGTPMRYISKFHNGSKVGDDQILNTVIMNKLNIFSVKTYDDVKQFLLQILGSDQKEFIREFTWLVFRKAAAEEKFCGLFAKLLSEIKKEYPVILEEMRKLHTTYLDIWKISESTDTTVDRRCRLGYSQFLAELTALSVLESETMQLTLETLKTCISDCIGNKDHTGIIEEYMDCLRQLCGSRVPKPVKFMIRELLVKDLSNWIEEPKELVPGLSSKSRFACMDLRDLLIKN